MGTFISRQSGLRKPLAKLGMDLLFFVVLVIPLAIFNLSDAVQPNIRGFFCSDNSIRYPYRKSTVPSVTLFLIGIPVVIVVTCFIECAHFKLYKPVKRGAFHPLIVALYRVFGYFIVGACINQILTDVTKLTAGRLRPMFLDVCQPSVACNSSVEHEYVLEYECTRSSYEGFTESEFEEMKTDIRKSFPSGHASFAMYCAVFAVVYLEMRLKYRLARMFKICCQALSISAAVWCCCTRFLDNKHHPTDIVFGAFYGITIGSFAIYLYHRSLTFPFRKEIRLHSSCSGSPTSVANRTTAHSFQEAPDSNGTAKAMEVVVNVDEDSQL